MQLNETVVDSSNFNRGMLCLIIYNYHDNFSTSSVQRMHPWSHLALPDMFGFTGKAKDWKIVYRKENTDIRQLLSREKHFKTGRSG